MTSPRPRMRRLAAACALACALLPARAHAARVTPAPAETLVTVAAGPQPLPLSQVPVEAERLALTRAAYHHAHRDFAAVVRELEPLSLATRMPFAESDRAAFLLGHAYLRLGQRARFAALARAVRAWPEPTPFTRWIAFEARLEGEAAPAGDAERTGQSAADAIAAGLLLREGRAEDVLALLPVASPQEPLLVALRAMALARLGRDDRAEQELLAAADTSTGLGRDLAGAARLRLAIRAQEAGGDPRPWLTGIDARSRYASRAQHLLALLAIERGEGAEGAARLDSLVHRDSTYAGRREAAATLAGRALDDGRWDDALRGYLAADADWQRERETLRRLLAPGAADALWYAWEHDRSPAEALVLDGMPAESLTEQLAAAAADLGAVPSATDPQLGVPPAADSSTVQVPPPPAEDWDRANASARALGAARGSLALAQDSLARERARLADLRRYHGYGLDEVRGERAGLAERSARLDSLRAAMEQTAQRLLRLRDAATLRFQRRAGFVLAELEAQERWIGAMKHFYLDGPDGKRQAWTPPQEKGPDVVLQQEAELAQSLRFSAGRMQAETPRRIAAAYEKMWGPRLLDRSSVLATGTSEALAWSRTLDRSLDSALATFRTSPEEQRLTPLTAALAQRERALAAADRELRAGIANTAVARALRTLETEREGLDYGLAAAAYARAVRLSASDSSASTAVVQGAQPNDSLAFEAAGDSAARAERAEAIARASIFLADHPGSSARGEMRFRLADLLVTEARSDFRTRMAAWLRAQSAGQRAPLPVVDHTQALTLYRHLLAEDTDFPHRDAVLFNAGMLLADTGDPGAGEYFARLLREHPGSPYVQEASLRLGDLAFDTQDLDGGVAHYERASGGGDPSLRAIALYKMGWAHYNRDRFEAAAQAFRGVLELYASDTRLAVQADIQHEAEQYFVYSLAAAGGADAFARAFPGGSERPYERRVLRAMGQHFRRYGEFAQAAAADELYLSRWPHDVAALEVAARLAETQEKDEHPERARATRLRFAEGFAPGGAWAVAQGSDSLRDAGAEFARNAWRAVAFEHHRKARTGGTREDWRAALTQYQTLLARWPGDSLASAYELYSGEACAELGDFPASLLHYRTAAATGRDSIAARAAWQVVAVTDRWYESTRPAAVKGTPRGTGRDSLARAVMAAADAFLDREPKHPQAADLVWRECQLTLAHGWTDDALVQLARFARDYPKDTRAPLAAAERADVYYRRGDYGPAGDAYEDAIVVARRAGADTLARRIERALPVCAYREAEAAVAADSTRHERHAELFAEVAKRWPAFEQAPVAQYRAGLAWLDAGRTADGVKALESLAEQWPKHVLAHEARLRVPKAWELANESRRAADAWLAFANLYPADDNADEAWLRAADLCDSSGQGTRADELRASYLKKWPADQESALEILESLARKELAALPAERSVGTLLVVPKAVAGAKPVPVPYLAQYLKRTAQKPALVSKPLLAEVRFRYAEEAFGRYMALPLTQPLPKSIAAKQRQLDSVLVRYRRTVDLGVPEWAHAATYRIGEALTGFGDALRNSERPADLAGDDLKAYENVLMEQSVTFQDRGENVWTELLKRSTGPVADAWVNRARGALWSKLGDRFLFQPESDFPMVEGTGPGKQRVVKPSSKDTTSGARPEPAVKPVANEDHD